ncbi:MAG TPA: hypothetical protein VFW25_10280, partial [Silvibacterium sp.]|nr:hypothetical protein [Silvibacterium sp.]
MNLSDIFARKNLCCAAAALLVAVGTTPAIAQRGIVDDWTNHHVKFMNPGSEMDAVMSGHRQQW